MFDRLGDRALLILALSPVIIFIVIAVGLIVLVPLLRPATPTALPATVQVATVAPTATFTLTPTHTATPTSTFTPTETETPTVVQTPTTPATPGPAAATASSSG